MTQQNKVVFRACDAVGAVFQAARDIVDDMKAESHFEGKDASADIAAIPARIDAAARAVNEGLEELAKIIVSAGKDKAAK